MEVGAGDIGDGDRPRWGEGGSGRTGMQPQKRTCDPGIGSHGCPQSEQPPFEHAPMGVLHPAALLSLRQARPPPGPPGASGAMVRQSSHGQGDIVGTGSLTRAAPSPAGPPLPPAPAFPTFAPHASGKGIFLGSRASAQVKPQLRSAQRSRAAMVPLATKTTLHPPKKTSLLLHRVGSGNSIAARSRPQQRLGPFQGTPR